MRRLLVRYFLLIALGAGLLQSCSYFARKPPLPTSASIERVEKPVAATDYNAIVENTDIIYFPTERIGFGARSEPSALLIEALEKRGSAFAIGWDLIETRQQPLLDGWATQDASTRQKAIALLEIFGNGRARAHCRAVLRELNSPNVSHLALLRSGDVSAHGSVRRQFAAGKIVDYLRAAAAGAKALIFLHEEDLESEQGVPEYVEQKIEARQLVFGPEDPKKRRTNLLTRTHIGGASKS